jgi:hypothetical protein
MLTAVLFTSAALWNQTRYSSIDELMNWFHGVYHGILFRHKVERNDVICRKIDGTGNHHVKWSKPDWERQISHALICRI